MSIDINPRTRAITLRGRQDALSFVEYPTRLAIARFFDMVLEKKLSGTSLSSDELTILDTYSKIYLVLQAVEIQVRALTADSTKTDLDYLPVDKDVSHYTYSRASFWASVLFDGSYANLTGKPTLFDGTYSSLSGKPTIPAAQVNSDWNSVSSVSQILNKPTIPANGVSLVGTATIAESSLLTLALTVRRVNVSVAGVTIGSNYIAIPTAALPAGYGIVDVICTTNGTLTFGMLVPILGVGSSYSISVRILKLTP